MADINRKTADGRDIKENTDDAPPNSRLFVVCGKDITEDDFRDAFKVHGTIEKIEIHRDKKGESKGIAYIKFSKTSEAAVAIEQLNGRCIGDHPRPLKVLIANSRDQGNSREFKEEERLLRLFVVVPKDQVETDLNEYFSRFGAVQYVNIVRDKETRISKGFAYIKYYRLSHAAKAFETCDRSYKPVFAEPRPPKYDGFTNGHIPRSISDPGSRVNSCVLSIVCSPIVNEDQLWRLFDLIPGLDYCELRQVNPRNNRSFGIAVYTNIRAATYAKKKLHGFEYPPGERLIVKFEPADDHNQLQYQHSRLTQAYSQLNHLQTYPHHLKTLADKIAQATSLIKAANLNDPCQYSYDPSYCTIALPRPQPLAPMDSNVEERLFVVCTPSTPPIYAVKDVFGRFGGLVDFYFLNGKRCGYALFSKADSAKVAMNSLNGQEICGSRMKVLLAEPTKGNFSE